MKFVQYGSYFLLTVDLLLVILHLLFPEYLWGQSRSSYFRFHDQLTLPSWFLAVQWMGVALFSLGLFHREYKTRTRYAWLLMALLALAFSFCEVTFLPRRLDLYRFPFKNSYETIFHLSWQILVLGFAGWILIKKFENVVRAKEYVMGALRLWGLYWFIQLSLSVLSTKTTPVPFLKMLDLARGASFLFAVTLLLLSFAVFFAHFRVRPQPRNLEPQKGNIRHLALFIGVALTALLLIFLQILLLRTVHIFDGNLAAYAVISIALFGIAVGGLLSYLFTRVGARALMLGSALLLPPSLLMAFSAPVLFQHSPLFVSFILMLPFILGSVILSSALVVSPSHLVYGVDLFGAALGALVANGAFLLFREEGSFFFLCALSFVVAFLMATQILPGKAKRMLIYVALLGFSLSVLMLFYQSQTDLFNYVREKLSNQYPKVEMKFSKSSLVGRYDVVRRSPRHQTLKAYENGTTIDTIRADPAMQFKVDPRIPYTLFENPRILILGLSGDGISKAAKAISTRIDGIEINPVVSEVHQNELIPFNANSYDGINVHVMDGRGFFKKSEHEFDMITLMNTHASQGSIEDRAPASEYLHTTESLEIYLDHLSENGVVIYEEPNTRPLREVAIWKLLYAMREALLNKGIERPEDHVFIFQWRASNNYAQILMKRTPFTDEELNKLDTWLRMFDDLEEIEAQTGQRLGQIIGKSTVLHSPRGHFETNYSKIIKGEMPEEFYKKRHVFLTTDDRPFHFAIDPRYEGIKNIYLRCVILGGFFLPLLFFCARNKKEGFFGDWSFLAVSLGTGMSYLLVEIALTHHYQIFLGSPVVAFSIVLGTLLVFSGLGSLWSGKRSDQEAVLSVFGIVCLLAFHFTLMPKLFVVFGAASQVVKAGFSVAAMAPLAFLMGVPFPVMMRRVKEVKNPSAAALLFAANASTSALAVPLALYLSITLGFTKTFAVGMLLYALIALPFISKPVLKKGFSLILITLVTFLFLSPFLLNRKVSLIPDSSETFRVYAVKYGESRVRASKVVQGASRSKKLPFAWMYWVIQGQGKTILVDTGFEDKKEAKKWGIKNYQKPLDQLQKLGIEPGDVTDVILTHAHWDHMALLSQYQNAKVWIQQSEYDNLKTLFARERKDRSGFRVEDFEALEKVKAEGRLQLVQGDAEPYKGIRLKRGGAHTPGQQQVIVEALDGNIVLAGDLTYHYRNNRRHLAIGATKDPEADLKAMGELHQVAASPYFIIPGHDRLVFKWFPEVAKDIVEITARKEERR